MKLNRPSSLPPEDRKELRQMREAKPWLWSFEALAEHFGTTRWTAMNICKKQAARADLDNAVTTYAALAKEAAA